MNYIIRHMGVLVLALMSTAVWGQTVSGTVTDENNQPLPGATVVVQGTNRGTSTDFDGKYQINATQGETLVFSYVGYASQSLAVSGATQNVSLQPDNALDEVVVTAQNILKDKKALGYAITDLNSESVENRPEADIARVLSGKIAGVNVVSTGGTVGGGTNITIRDAVSITGNNQPLFVVDGIPFDSSTDNQSNVTTGNGSVSASSRFLDLDPNNITNISILKGLSATVLYGNAGRNGVILITTKGGAAKSVGKGYEFSFSQSTFYNEISSLPDYQNTYGQGGDNSTNVGYVGNWGARFDGNYSVRHHYNVSRLAEPFPQYQGVQVPFKAFKNNVKNFFRKGLGTTTSLNVSKASENINYTFSFGHNDEEGYVQENSFKRNNLGLGIYSKLDNNLELNASFKYTTSLFKTPPIAANNGTGNFSVFSRTLFIPRNLDLENLPYQNPIDGSSVYYRTDQEHPMWLVDNSQESIKNNRFFSSVSLGLELNQYLHLMYRLGYDTYNENQRFYINKGGVSQLIAQQGFLRTTSAINTVWDHSLILNVKGIDLSEDIGLTGTFGVNSNSDNFEKTGLASSGQIAFNFIDHNNFSSQSNRDPLGSSLDYVLTENTVGVYGQLEFDFNDYAYLNLSARKDWSSTVEKDNRSLLYPGASISIIPTTIIPELSSDFFNYLKFRASYGTSAGFPDPYLTRPTLSIETAVFTTQTGSPVNTISSSNLYPNPDLKAELHKEIEVGVETKFWNNRVSLEASVFKRDSEDQILTKFLDNSTGFRHTYINAGKIESKGLEIELTVNPFRNTDSNVQWTSQYAFSSYQNEVLDLPGKIVDGKRVADEVFIAGFSNLGNYAIEGQPLGVIKGSYALKDEDGNYLINPSTGNIIDSDAVGKDDKIIGDPNADWRLTSINSISYKGFSLSAQLEYVHGGDVSSNTIANLLRRGVTKDTEDREGTFVIKGYYADPDTGEILLDANKNKIPNTIQLGANEVYFLNFVDPSSQQIYDATTLRLREISFSYSFPDSILAKGPFESVVLSFIGNNLWFYTPNIPKYTNFDPETVSTGVGNGRGLEFQTAPTAKKYGINLKLNF